MTYRRRLFALLAALLLAGIATPHAHAQMAADSGLIHLEYNFVSSIAWNFDGTLLAVSNSPDIDIWDTTTWDLTNTITDALPVTIAWHPSASQIAAVHNGIYEEVVIWEALTGDVVAELSRPMPEGAGMSWLGALAWSPDGTQIVTDGGIDTLLLWDLTAEDNPQTLAPRMVGIRPHAVISDIAWSPDGRYLLTGARLNRVSALLLWDATTGDLLRTSFGGCGQAVWSADSARYAITCGVARIYDVASGGVIASAPDAFDGGGNLYWHAETNQITNATNPGELGVWDIDTGLVYKIPFSAPGTQPIGTYRDIAWNPTGDTLAAAGEGGVIIVDIAVIPDVPAGDEIVHLPFPTAAHIGWNADGTRLAASVDNALHVWQADAWNTPLIIPDAPADAMAWHPSEARIATFHADTRAETLTLWDGRTGEALAVYTHPLPPDTPPAFMSTLAWKPDGTQIATSSAATSVLMWDMTGETEPYPLLEPDPDAEYASAAIWELDWRADGDLLLAAGTLGFSESIYIWDAASGETVIDAEWCTGPVSWGPPDTDRYVFACDNVRVMSLADGDFLGDYLAITPDYAFGGGVTHVAWQYETDLIALAYGWGALLLWDYQRDRRFEVYGLPLIAYSDVAWQPGTANLTLAGTGGVVIMPYALYSPAP